MSTTRAARTLTAPLVALTGLLALLAASALLLAPAATALPPGGAGGSTAGTSSTVTGQTAVGGTISFTLSGFPAGETVYVKIDDGLTSGEDSSTQGTGVVYSTAVDASGSASGSFALPSYVGQGQHWLRFLATSSAGSKDGGNVGYTNKSPLFTVGSTSTTTTVQEGGGSTGSAGSQAGTQSGAAGTSGTTSTQAGTQAGNQAGAVPIEATEVTLQGGQATATAEATDQATAEAATPAAAEASAIPAPTTPATSGSSSSFPVIGVAALGGAVLLVAIGIVAALRLRNRQTPGEPTAQPQ